MAIVLVLALVGSPPDMIGDPEPRVRVSAPNMIGDPFVPRVIPASLRVDPEPTSKPETPPAAPPKPPAMPAPQIHYRKDVTGKTWYHTDPRWLETYVGRINASQVPRYYFPSYQFSGSACAGGSCPR